MYDNNFLHQVRSVQKLSRKTVLKIPLRTLGPMAFRIYALTQLHTFKFKIIGQNSYNKALDEN